jgi:hypothetical protein
VPGTWTDHVSTQFYRAGDKAIRMNEHPQRVPLQPFSLKTNGNIKGKSMQGQIEIVNKMFRI